MYETCWQGEQDTLKPVEESLAADIWERMYDQRVDFKEAFPGLGLEEA